MEELGIYTDLYGNKCENTEPSAMPTLSLTLTLQNIVKYMQSEFITT